MRDAVKALVSAGAGLRSKDCGGMTASELAACMGFESVYEMLEGVPVTYGDLGQEVEALKEGLSGRGGEKKVGQDAGDGKEDLERKERGGMGERGGEGDDKVEALGAVGMEPVDAIAQTGHVEPSPAEESREPVGTEELTAREPVGTEEVTAREPVGTEVTAREPVGTADVTAQNVVDLISAGQVIMTNVMNIRDGVATDVVKNAEVTAGQVDELAASGKAVDGNVPEGGKKKNQKKKKR
jgi:hypothetical protein